MLSTKPTGAMRKHQRPVVAAALQNSECRRRRRDPEDVYRTRTLHNLTEANSNAETDAPTSRTLVGRCLERPGSFSAKFQSRRLSGFVWHYTMRAEVARESRARRLVDDGGGAVGVRDRSDKHTHRMTEDREVHKGFPRLIPAGHVAPASRH